ncbi:MalY/PatB family protein [Flavobacterium foetidum]|uniref:MalY/PatB family protein n=1 Tax=Flavobacterium foetidum TaxID=2026681 RepID=UPI001074A6A2|nr:MalY/PatB family protein [Flavobacterium foetidum]KAF2508105.1 pyridoxal phosphate-dependent aminotransferase [Flavobacterium foetidum]
MDYNFDEVINRRNTNSVKWDETDSPDILPMWVADMDFKTAPEIIQALENRISHGVFGYSVTSAAFFDAVIMWWKKRHGFLLQKEWILPVVGVIPAMSAAIRAITEKGDKIIIQPPVYNHFYSTIENSGREIVENNLIYKDGFYTIDFDDLEKKASDSKAKIAIVCNPHNPVGRVWTRQELNRIAEICKKYGVVVFSDEIHSDIVLNGEKHIPFASLDHSLVSNSITFSSISKTFNLAGLHVGYVFTTNEELYSSVKSVLVMQEMELLSPFATTALIAAYEKGEQWLEKLKSYVYENFLFLKQYIEEELPQVKVMQLQATYLVWLDIRSFKLSSDQIAKRLLDNQKLWVNSGTMYGKAGEGFLRINIACPKKILQDGLQRIKKELLQE